MTGNLQPLDQKFPIVTPDGRPTLYFIKWAQQKQIDIGQGITAEQALAIIEQYLADHQLQEGSGISISPSGNLSDAPTIAAEVQAILDQITTTRGSILFRGVDDWQALAPGTAGQFLKTNGAGADPSWAAGGGGGGAWALLATRAMTANPTEDFTGLGGYSEIMVLCRLVTASVSGVRIFYVSVDGGATFYTNAADYVIIQDAGTEVGSAGFGFHATNATAARSGLICMSGNVAGALKTFQVTNRSTDQTRLLIASTAVVDAIRVANTGGGNLTGGTIYVYGR